MPYHVARWSRRKLLCRSVGAGVGLLLPGCASYVVFQGLPGGPIKASDVAEPCERWALLSDTHISADPEAAVGPITMADHLRVAISDVLHCVAPTPTAPEPLSGVIVNGDCAFQFGRLGDYATFAQLMVDPISRAGVPIHLTLGNHDHHQHFVAALSNYARPSTAGARALDGRLVSIIPGHCANFFLLDTLDERYILAGGVGKQQLDWLADALNQFSDRPAIVVGHHPLDPENDLLGNNTSLLDAPPLWDVLTRFPHVKAYVYGHTHRWNVTRRQGIYLVNLPSTAYTFDAGQPQGWVEMWLSPSGARLQLHHVTAGHTVPEPGDSAVLSWA